MRSTVTKTAKHFSNSILTALDTLQSFQTAKRFNDKQVLSLFFNQFKVVDKKTNRGVTTVTMTSDRDTEATISFRK